MSLKLILVAGFVVMLLALLGVIRYGSEGFISGFDTAGAPPVGEFVMYYADWCPHCQSVKPDWKDFGKNGYVTVNGKNVKVGMVEESEKDKMAGKNVKGFPTFLFSTTEGQSIEYSGPRTKDSWFDFLAQNVGK
jgi:thiol-disulfide isomerase/thioredoxin